MTPKSRQFGKTPYWFIAEGGLRFLTEGPALLLLVICVHASGTTGQCWLSDERINKLTGLSKSGIRKSRRKLSELGILSYRSGKGPGNATSYQVHFERPKDFALPDEDKAPRRGNKRLPRGPKKSYGGERKGVPGEAPTELNRVEQNQQQVAATPPVAGFRTDQEGTAPPFGRGSSSAEIEDDPTVSQNRRALTEEGVVGKMRSKLAQLPSLTPAKIDEAVQKARAKNGGPGLIISILEADDESLQAKEAAAKERAAAAEARERLRQQQESEAYEHGGFFCKHCNCPIGLSNRGGVDGSTLLPLTCDDCERERHEAMRNRTNGSLTDNSGLPPIQTKAPHSARTDPALLIDSIARKMRVSDGT